MKLSPMLSAARRQQFPSFLMKVYETLHPGRPPLELSWYLRAICHALDQVYQGDKRRLVITVPPRHLKSITASVAFVAWTLGSDPAKKIIVASYSQELARELSNATRSVMESEWYQNDFPGTRISDRGNRALDLQTTKGGYRKAVSVQGACTGFGADIIIVDDAMKADEARSPTLREEARNWLDGTLFGRLNDQTSGSIISIQQRLHEDDLPAYMLGKGYAHLNLPAIAESDEQIPIGNNRSHHRRVGDVLNPARQDLTILEQMRREVGPQVFSAQYQQEPITAEGNMLRLHWFGTYDERPERHRLIKVVQSWDTAMSTSPSSDYSVCTTWGFEWEMKKWYLLDVFRARLDFPDLRRKVLELRTIWKPDRVIIEKAGTGLALCQDLRGTEGMDITMIAPRGAKEERFNGCLGEIEAGYFVLPCEAPWLDAFKAELRAFPFGKHDDQVDSVSQFVKHQLTHWSWVMTEYMPDGRARDDVRLDHRPW